MCNFLELFIGDVVAIKYIGKMLPEKMTMSTSQKIDWYLGSGTTFYGSNAVSKIESEDGKDRLSFKANIYLARTLESFPGNYDLGKIHNGHKFLIC